MPICRQQSPEQPNRSPPMADILTRTAADTTVPTAGTYQLDPSHSSADFQVRHLGLSKVRGGFAIESGAVVIADDPPESSAEVTLDATCSSTGSADRHRPDERRVGNECASAFRSRW